MIAEDRITENNFQCAHCEASGEISFDALKRQHQQNDSIKIWVRFLPDGISDKGVKNLFLTIGNPLCIRYSPRSNTALVTFESLNEAELAVRDLHLKPPYNLKVTVAKQQKQQQNGFSAKREENNFGVKDPDSWDFSVQQNPVECEAEGDSKKIIEITNQVRNLVSSLGYDPLIRMRQRKLDHKTRAECASLGRGYLFMGKVNRFVGGLQKCEFTAENGKAKDKMSYVCQNCKATSTKICGNCCVPYCSKVCLNQSSTDHRENCSTNSFTNGGVGNAAKNNSSNSNFTETSLKTSQDFPEVQFTSGCTVVMSSYCTMQTVFVRRSDAPWEERFARLCNAVAVEAIKGVRLSGEPKEGEVVAAKYYEDLCFYRAQILSNSNGKILVLFIDFGNTQETEPEDLLALSDYLQCIPGYASRVQLKNVSEDSSLESVDYFNKLTAERIPLIMNFEESTDEVLLVEKDTKTNVNKTVFESALPSWKKDDFVFSKLGEIFYLDSIKRQKLEVKKTCSLIISHFDEKEFSDCEVFWVNRPDTDDFIHVSSKMRLLMMEYCELLKHDYYLPRTNELCLAKENEEWYRCVNLQSHKTSCCLFFLDDGHSSFIETKNIRKMIEEFTEAPAQAVCCVLQDDAKLKADKEVWSKVVRYLKESSGKRIDSVHVLKLLGDAYCLTFPRINDILMQIETKE